MTSKRVHLQFAVLVLVLGGLAACSSETTNTNKAPTPATTNANSQPNSNAASSTVDDQKRLEAYVVDFVSKTFPKNISEEPDFQCKLAVVEKKGNNAKYVPYSEFERYAQVDIMQKAVRPTFAKSVEELRAIVLLEPGRRTLSVIDTAKQQIVAEVPMENYEGPGASTLEAALYISNSCFGKTN